MIENIRKMWKIPELRRKIIYTFLMLVLFRDGLSVGTVLTCLLFFVYGCRLGGFLLIRELKEALPELRILILEPFVLEGPATEHAISTFTTEVAKRAAVCKELAEEHGLIFIPLQEKLEALAQATSNTYVLIDGVHPNTAGYELISRELYAAYSKIL